MFLYCITTFRGVRRLPEKDFVFAHSEDDAKTILNYGKRRQNVYKVCAVENILNPSALVEKFTSANKSIVPLTPRGYTLGD
jgi:hypothetical protein